MENNNNNNGSNSSSVHRMFGMHPVFEAINSGANIEKVYLKQGLDGLRFRELMDLMNEKGINYQFVPMEKLNALTKGARHQGVVATISQIEHIPMEEAVEKALQRGNDALVVLLDGVSDVRNFGAIARSAECAGAGAIILPAKGGAAVNADAIKSSAGALLRMTSSKVPNLKMAIFHLQDAGFQVIAATERADKSIYEINFKQPTAILMGSEDKGISPSLLALCNDAAKIPMIGEIGSLNVSVATSIVLFEALRQRVGK